MGTIIATWLQSPFVSVEIRDALYATANKFLPIQVWVTYTRSWLKSGVRKMTKLLLKSRLGLNIEHYGNAQIPNTNLLVVRYIIALNMERGVLIADKRSENPKRIDTYRGATFNRVPSLFLIRIAKPSKLHLIILHNSLE